MNGDEMRSPPISPSRASIGSDGGTIPLRSPVAIPLPAVKPAPAYISQAAASEFSINRQRERLEAREATGDQEPREVADATFGETGLALINGFIDHLLYQFLATARSTSLSALRPAVEHVLKPKLARQAFANADEELHDLLGDDEDEEDENVSVQSNDESREQWDQDAVWRMTRLKVMVYTSTSDLDDEEEEQLSAEHMSPSEHRQSRHFGLVSWTASIFLTSILEFVGEHCLTVAGQAAYDRSTVKRRSKLSSDAQDVVRGVIVDEYDVERIALSSSLGRLWRSWKKSLRSTRSLILSSPTSSRRPSITTNHSPQASKSGDETRSDHQNESHLNTLRTSPIQEQDAEERREKNAKAFDETQNERDLSNLISPTLSHSRSRSFGILPTVAPITENEVLETPSRPTMARRRSSSLPNPLRANPPDIFAEDVEPVPDIPEHIANEMKQEAVRDENQANDDNVPSDEVTHPRSVTPFEGESEYAADSERPDTAISNYTNSSITEHDTQATAESSFEPIPEQDDVADQPAVSAPEPMVEDSHTVETEAQDAESYHDESEDEMDAAAAAAALNSLPPSLSKREMSADMVIASAVPGAFPTAPELRQEHHTQLQTVEEDQELNEDASSSYKQTSLDVKDISRGEKAHAVSTTMVAVPSNPSSIYDDAPQERQSFETDDEPATPPRDHRRIDSTQFESPAQSKMPAYTGTTVTILNNASAPKERYFAPRIASPPVSHAQTASQSSSTDDRVQTATTIRRATNSFSDDNETMERNFEGLMASETPKKYTLTPKTLRVIETGVDSQNGSNDVQTVARRKGGQTFNVMSAKDGQMDRPPPPPPKPLGPSWSVKYSRPSQNNSRPSRNGFLAREPRIQTESLREFADFIRSTAPDARPGPGGHVVPILIPENTSGQSHTASLSASAKSGRPSIDKYNDIPNQQTVPSPPMSAGATRKPNPNLTAREAATPRSNVNAELIDFLNNGPAGATTSQGPSSPRVNGKTGARSYDNLKTYSNSYDNRASSTTTPSVQDSLHSHSPLLNHSQSSRSPMPLGGAPVRKQRRVKDPYALPSDDEDEEDFPAPPIKSQSAQQESLIDFLNNYDPPGSRQGAPYASAKAQKMLGANGRSTKPAPPIAPHGSNDSSQVSLEASALPEFLRANQQSATPDSYTMTTITSLSSQQGKPKKGFWKKK